MICRNCYRSISDKEKICPLCHTRQDYILGAISDEKLDVFRLLLAEKSGRGYDVTDEQTALARQRRDGWCNAFGTDVGLYARHILWREDRRTQEFRLRWGGSVLIDGRTVYLPTKSYLFESENGISILLRDRFGTYTQEFFPLEDTSEIGAVLFGGHIVLPVRHVGENGYRFAVVRNREPRAFLGYLPTANGAPLRIVGKLPRLIVDAERCLLFVAGESAMYGYVFTGSKFFVPFKAEAQLDLDYLNGSGILRDVVYVNGKFFFALLCARDKNFRWKIAAAEVSSTDNGGFHLSPRTFPLYAGQSVLRVFIHDNTLYWLSLHEGALLLFDCGTNFSDTGLADYTERGKMLLASTRFINTVDMIEFDGASLTIYGHASGDERYVRRVRACIVDGNIRPVPGEKSIYEEMVNGELPFLFLRTAVECVPFPRICSSKNTTVFVDGETIIKVR